MAPMAMGDITWRRPRTIRASAAMVTATSTNIHFHGLNVPPVCHQDDVIKTIIPNHGDPPSSTRFRSPPTILRAFTGITRTFTGYTTAGQRRRRRQR